MYFFGTGAFREHLLYDFCFAKLYGYSPGELEIGENGTKEVKEKEEEDKDDKENEGTEDTAAAEAELELSR